MSPDCLQKLVQELQTHQAELKRHNAELRQAQSSYAELYEAAPVGYFVLNRQGEIIQANQLGAGLLGVKKGLLLHRPLLEWVAPEDREACRAHFQKVFETGVRQSCELKLRPRQGLPMYVALASIAAPMAGEISRHCRTIMSDITSRQQVEDDLKLKEQLLDSASDSIFLHDLDGHFTYLNEAAYKDRGYEKEDLLKKDIFALMSPKYAKVREKLLQKLKDHGEIIFESVHLRQDGSTLPVEIHARLIDLKDRRLILSIARNITWRKRADQEIARLASFPQLDPNPVLEVDAAGNLTFSNPAALKIAQALGLQDLKSLLPADLDEILQAAREKGERQFYREVTAKGAVFAAQIHFAPQFQVARLYLEDITEQWRVKQALQGNETKFRTIVETAQEGIWVFDEASRISYANQRVAEMLGYTVEEMRGRHIFDFVDDADRELAQEKIGRRRQGRSETFDFQLRRQDGSFIWTMMAAATLADPQGDFIGSLGMITNITERKLAEAALQQSEELYRSLFENMLNGFAYCKMVFEQDQPKDFIFLEVNNSFETLTGLKNVVGKAVSEVIPGLRKSNPELFEIYGRVALTGIPERFETYVPAIKMWFSISVYSPQKEYFVIVFDVITSQKEAEEALRAAAHNWRTTFDAIGDGVCLLDRDGKILQGNQAMADLAGKPVSEIIGHFCWEIMCGNSGVLQDCPFKRMQQSRHRETLSWPMGDRWQHAIVDPILDETGEVSGAVYIIIDITAHKRSQEKIQDLNNLLQAIKNINETLLRAKSEPELFQRTCDLLKGVPYIRFVWIGLVKQDSFEVEPVAWAGVEDGYLSVIKVSWDDSEYGRGPTGETIRTRKPMVRRSIETDPKPNPWREEALKRGYKSSITLPFIQENEVIGILKVYAGKEEAFGVEEVEFLNQVAGDIAVGVKSLRLEQGLKQSLSQLQSMMRQTVESIAAISEIRDPYTAGHQRRVTQLACALAKELGLDHHRIEGCRVTGFLHDIGKVVVPAEILSKPGKLNEYEMSIIRTHVKAGYDILKNIDFPWPVADIVMQHHERLDGSGYPAGLKGDQILFEAKILMVADVVEAISSHRPYRAALGPEAAIKEISLKKGILYDPEVVEACVKLFKAGAIKFN